MIAAAKLITRRSLKFFNCAAQQARVSSRHRHPSIVVRQCFRR